MRFISATAASQAHYDVVIVGGGIMGSILAKRLSRQGRTVLIIEAGVAQGADYGGYLSFLDRFHQATVKIPNSPFPLNPNAPEPTVVDPTQISPPKPSANGYFVQFGPLPFRSSYTTALGGTTLHWLGTTLRMLPEDFDLYSRFGQGRDWPISYEDLEPYYQQAERELGVSAEVEEQAYGGVYFPKDYVYPMHTLPPSYSDQQLAQQVNGLNFEIDGEQKHFVVRSTPVARNSIPNVAYDGGKPFKPVGAVGNPGVGERCMGNSSCVPLCPIQAKYNGLRSLTQADFSRAAIVAQSVATKLQIDPDSGRISGVEFKHYPSLDEPTYTTHTARGTIVVLAAHAVANAMLLLASGACRSSGLVGKHLMDHPELLAWGLAERPLWPFRGPLSTSGIEEARYGRFRANSAAFRMEMGNDGWLWPANAPVQDVEQLVNDANLFGPALKARVGDRVSRQFRFGVLVEQLPEACNNVTIDPNYLDQLGNYRPIIRYDLSDYTRAGFAQARRACVEVFERAGIDDRSIYATTDPGYFEYEGAGYVFNGAGHFAGTHCMGANAKDGVVDRRQRAFDHDNLYLVGCGNMVTLGTSNPTLTATALTCWASDNILRDLEVGP